MFRDYVLLSINGKVHRLYGRDAFLPLSDYLRYERGLTGTKVVCAEGDCGACTVMQARVAEVAGVEAAYRSLNSCISAALLLDGCQIVTVEGLNDNGELCEVQESMVRNFGSQCGFCTPGFVMSLAHMYECKSGEGHKVSEQNAKNYLTGNLCRCTGYQPILKAALDVDVKKHRRLSERYPLSGFKGEFSQASGTPILVKWEENEFFAPVTLRQAVEYKAENPGARIFSGATDLGVQINKGRFSGTRRMSLHLLPELYRCEEKNGEVTVGARATLDRLQKLMEEKAPKFGEFLNIFASPQIKNAATLVGNLANGSPIADTTPFLLTADAQVDLFGVNGSRAVALRDFILDYKKMDLREDELITAIRFRLPAAGERQGLYKVSQRRDLDISCVNSSFSFQIERGKIQTAKIAYGGVGPTAMRLTHVEKFLAGRALSSDTVERAKELIAESIKPLSDVRGSSEFRTRVSQNLFEKFWQEGLR